MGVGPEIGMVAKRDKAGCVVESDRRLEGFLSRLDDLKVKIFADGADLAGILELYKNPIIKGFTTNPTLMKQSGISDYREFARTLLRAVPDRPISFEVFADEFGEMESQALEIASWGGMVFVKVPVTNTRGESS